MKWLMAWLVLLPSVAIASDGWKQVGKGEMHMLFWHVYDTTLTSPNGIYDVQQPYALENLYHMDFTANELAERSIEEMRHHATFDDAQAASWREALVALWPDIREGDKVRAVAIPNRHVRFYVNDAHVGDVNDPTFVRPFMDIWLGENTSEPSLRSQLLSSE